MLQVTDGALWRKIASEFICLCVIASWLHIALVFRSNIIVVLDSSDHYHGRFLDSEKTLQSFTFNRNVLNNIVRLIWLTQA